MANLNELGVYQQSNGFWFYRYTVTIDGKRHEHKGTKDEYGNKLRTKKEAIKARDAARAADNSHRNSPPQIQRRTVSEVYQEYCNFGRSDRAYQTKRKQDSLWQIHLKDRFGKRFVDEIPVAEVNDYLAELYYDNGLSFRYVESFLKMFYLIFGQAYSRNHLDNYTYCKLCKNKDTKIHMPKMRDEDDTDIIAFDRSDLTTLDLYFKDTFAETAYMLGRYCGLRINECYGLKWDHIDFENNTILIDRQMQYQDGLIKLVPVKTRNGKRSIYMCNILKVYLQSLKEKMDSFSIRYALLREQKQRFIIDLNGQKFSSLELVNTRPDGSLQTVNSMKYPSRILKSKYGIDFKYHYLRHTYGTMMAEVNTPQHLLCNQMGHGNIRVTQRYYLAVTKSGAEILQEKANLI